MANRDKMSLGAFQRDSFFAVSHPMTAGRRPASASPRRSLCLCVSVALLQVHEAPEQDGERHPDGADHYRSGHADGERLQADALEHRKARYQ